jgi:hypothetical protein
MSKDSYCERCVAAWQGNPVGCVHVQLRPITRAEVMSWTYGLVVRTASRDGALRAAVSRVAGVGDGDLVGAGSGTALGVSGGEGREEEHCDFGKHFEKLLSEGVGC